MKKTFGIAAAFLVSVSPVPMIVGCTINQDPKVEDNVYYSRTTIDDYENTYDKWNSISNGYIKNFSISDYKMKVTKDYMDDLYLKMKESQDDSVINNWNGYLLFKENIVNYFSTRMRVNSFLQSSYEFRNEDINLTLNELTLTENKDVKFKINLNFINSTKVFKNISGLIAEANYDPITVINDENMRVAFENATKEMNLINWQGFFISLNFKGEKDVDLNWTSDQRVSVEEIETKNIDYLFSFLKGLNIVSQSLNPTYKNIEADAVNQRLVNGNTVTLDEETNEVVFNKEIDFGPHSIVTATSFYWREDKSISFQLTGSYLQDGQKY